MRAEIDTIRPPAKSNLQWSEALRDGTAVRIRPMTSDDAELERQFLGGLSIRTRRLRFLAIVEPSNALVKRLTTFDPEFDLALVALPAEGPQIALGVARFCRCQDEREHGREERECAVVVADQWQRRGLGTLLMNRLVECARERGVRRLISFDAAANEEMDQLARKLHFRRERDPFDPTLVRHVLEIPEIVGAAP